MATDPLLLPIEYSVLDVCTDLAKRLEQRDVNIAAEQLLEGFGGISNLYLEQLVAGSRAEIRVRTNDTFASELVPLQRMIVEIGYCIGCTREIAADIVSETNGVVADRFRAHHRIYCGAELSISPLGLLTLEDLDTFSYLFTYRDPAADTHSIYLLGKGISESISSQSEASYFAGIELFTQIGDELRGCADAITTKGLKIENDVDAAILYSEAHHVTVVKFIKSFITSLVEIARPGGVVRIYVKRQEADIFLVAELANIDGAALSTAYSLLLGGDLEQAAATPVAPRVQKYVTMTIRDGGQLTLSMRIPGIVPVRSSRPARTF